MKLEQIKEIKCGECAVVVKTQEELLDHRIWIHSLRIANTDIFVNGYNPYELNRETFE